MSKSDEIMDLIVYSSMVAMILALLRPPPHGRPIEVLVYIDRQEREPGPPFAHLSDLIEHSVASMARFVETMPDDE